MSEAFYPFATEKAYERKLVGLIDELHKAINRFLVGLNNKGLITDSNDDDIKKQWNDYFNQLSQSVGVEMAANLAVTMLSSAERMANSAILSQLQSVADFETPAYERYEKMFGIEPSDDEKTYLKNKISENVNYISGLSSDYLDRVSGIVYRGVTNNHSLKFMTEQIQNATQISERRAKTIARSETGSAYGAFTKMKQESAGIKYFRWSTVGDSRVRDEHQAIDGKVFPWSGGWGGVFPGEPINCRCTAEPVFDDELDESELFDPDDLEAKELTRKHSAKNALNYDGPMPAKEFKHATDWFIKQGGVITSGLEIDDFLDKRGALGITYAQDVVFLKTDADRATVYEEMFHANQLFQGKIPSGDEQPIKNEIEAQNYLINNWRMLKLSKKQLAETKVNLEYWKEQLENVRSNR
ncbi:hypothetical protein ESZ50_04770 [Weissella muntiaci]|uniref:Phage head morphogenesis domain-containing protein n=1 Tax=Weissella muntiaci TaxID=2508881 RepID=A0A6C2C7G4_9LACO|nr:minor capsid protein [Weissella muntiaci]TYC49908.1 hypothetical protein ESZ50_04770 [Weissella muntiaci]